LQGKQRGRKKKKGKKKKKKQAKNACPIISFHQTGRIDGAHGEEKKKEKGKGEDTTCLQQTRGALPRGLRRGEKKKHRKKKKKEKEEKDLEDTIRDLIPLCPGEGRRKINSLLI